MTVRSGAAAARLAIGVAVGVLAMPAMARAQAQPKVAPQKVDAKAIAALSRMGAFLRSQPTMAIKAEVQTDDVLDSGQKVRRGGVAELKVRRPDRMRIDFNGDLRQQQHFYDGKTFTLYDQRTGYYAAFRAPGTLAELVEVAEHQYGIDLPLVDLFRWGSDKDTAAMIQSATSLGPSAVRGTPCDHFAFRGEDVDWQIWIERGDRPVPRKVVITTTSERIPAEHEMVLDWTFAPQLSEQTFAFAAPASAKKIEFQAAAPAPGPTPMHQGRSSRPGRPSASQPTPPATRGTTP